MKAQTHSFAAALFLSCLVPISGCGGPSDPPPDFGAGGGDGGGGGDASGGGTGNGGAGGGSAAACRGDFALEDASAVGTKMWGACSTFPPKDCYLGRYLTFNDGTCVCAGPCVTYGATCDKDGLTVCRSIQNSKGHYLPQACVLKSMNLCERPKSGSGAGGGSGGGGSGGGTGSGGGGGSCKQAGQSCSSDEQCCSSWCGSSGSCD